MPGSAGGALGHDLALLLFVVTGFDLLLVLAVLLGSGEGAGVRAALESPRVAAALHVALSEPSVAARLSLVTEPLLGARYVGSPLGEGQGRDPDPRMRLDAFDCTTFVETAIALGRGSSLAEARAGLDAIRYRGGEPTFLARRHFPDAEWLPELIALGVLVDITPEVGGAEVVRRSRRLPEPGSAAGALGLPEERLPRGLVSIEVWPLERARRGASRIPEGTVLSLVRTESPAARFLVTHQGLVLARGGQPFLRHASVRPAGAVVDEPLEAFFARVARFRSWPVDGVNLAAVAPP